jgi:hypothetical protein
LLTGSGAVHGAEQVVVAMSRQAPKHGSYEELERHEGRDRIAGQAEQERRWAARIRAVIAGCPGRAERERLARLDRDPPQLDGAEGLESGPD